MLAQGPRRRHQRGVCIGSAGTLEHHTRFHLFSITRGAVARKLHDLDQAGCCVDVVHTTIDGGSHNEPTSPFTACGGARAHFLRP
ncbi:hypothetical protein AB0L06_41435 [Spirillospora sp. NPDC052269]